MHIPIAQGREAFRTLVHSLAVSNAAVRNFSTPDDGEIGGGGWVDLPEPTPGQTNRVCFAGRRTEYQGRDKPFGVPSL